MKHQYMYYSQLYKLFTFLIIVFFLLFGNDSLAQKKSGKKKTENWDLEFSLSSYYDNNILKYSDKYLERFDRHEDEGRFHINTYDDLILTPDIQATYTFRIFGKLNSKVDASVSKKLYSRNNIKNFSSIGFGFRQYLTKNASFKISYSYIPEFYIRHFRDDDWVDIYGYTKETFKPMSFSKDNYGFWIQNTFFKNTRIMFSMYYSVYYYNTNFTEYDSKNMQYGLKIYQPLSKKLKLILGYQYTTSDAKGYDQPFETKFNSDDSDGSYAEDAFTIGIDWRLPQLFKRNNNLGLDCEIENRYFPTTNFLEDDPTHAGRVDNNFNFSTSYDIALNKKFGLEVFYDWYYRDTYTTANANKEYLSDEKDYSQFQLGLKITYNFSL